MASGLQIWPEKSKPPNPGGFTTILRSLSLQSVADSFRKGRDKSTTLLFNEWFFVSMVTISPLFLTSGNVKKTLPMTSWHWSYDHEKKSQPKNPIHMTDPMGMVYIYLKKKKHEKLTIHVGKYINPMESSWDSQRLKACGWVKSGVWHIGGHIKIAWSSFVLWGCLFFKSKSCVLFSKR